MFVPTFFKVAARYLLQKHALIRNELASKLYDALKDTYEDIDKEEPQEREEAPAPEQLEALLEGEGMPYVVMPPGTVPPAASTPVVAAPALQQRE